MEIRMSKQLSPAEKQLELIKKQIKANKKSGKVTFEDKFHSFALKHPKTFAAGVAGTIYGSNKAIDYAIDGIKKIPDLMQENTYNYYVAYLNKQITEEELIEKINSGEISKEHIEMLQEEFFDNVKKVGSYIKNNPVKIGVTGALAGGALGGTAVAGASILGGGALAGGALAYRGIKKANEKYDLTGKAKKVAINTAKGTTGVLVQGTKTIAKASAPIIKKAGQAAISKSQDLANRSKPILKKAGESAANIGSKAISNGVARLKARFGKKS